MNLVHLSDLQPDDIRHIWSLVNAPGPAMQGTVAWSFEGKGIRTRSTFIEAFRQLGLSFTELPHLLQTSERACDLAGYLDPFYALYVVRESDHARLAQVLGFELVQVCHRRFHEALPHVAFVAPSALPSAVDVVITDCWPAGAEADAETQTDMTPLTEEHLAAMGSPALLPTPPFTLGRELTVDPLEYPGFVGYQQKELLLTVQTAIIRWAMSAAMGAPSDAPSGGSHADR